jgi:hypothetical protein
MNVGARHASPSILTVILQVSIAANQQGEACLAPTLDFLHLNSERLHSPWRLTLHPIA